MWTRRALVCAAAALLAGCPRAPAVRQHQPPLDEPIGPAASDRAALEADLAKSIRESYAALSDGYEEAYLESLARDKRLVMIDVGPEDVLIGFESLDGSGSKACALRRQFENDQAQFKSKRLEVHVSDDGTAGWSYDEISYRVLHEGRRVIIPLRATAVYERRGGRWLLVQQHVSYAVPEVEVFTAAASGRITAPAPLGAFTAPADEAAQAAAVVRRLISDTDDAAAAHVVDDPRLLVLGLDPDAELRGKAAFDKATVRALFGFDYQVTIRGDDLRVKTSATGQVAWAAANVVVDNGREGNEHVALPLRATFVLERKEGVWHMVQMHVSVGITSDELSLRVLGETWL
jgi:ketosteroid isomerase-like protein